MLFLTSFLIARRNVWAKGENADMEQIKCCENCKHSDLDYIFDDEIGEEYPLYTCQK
jgi:hypothetical protein